jgi:hypothetical protein
MYQSRSPGVNWPDPPFRHLIRITDHIGLLEYSEGASATIATGRMSQAPVTPGDVPCRGWVPLPPMAPSRRSGENRSPGHTVARRLLAAAVGVIGEPSGNPAWPWPAPRLS